MHVIKPHTSAVTLFHDDGAVSVYASLTRALKALGMAFIRMQVGANFKEYSHTLRPGGRREELLYTTHRFVMRDDFGEPLTAAHFEPLLARRGISGCRPYRFWNGEGPVPFTACYRGGCGYYRHRNTTQERRQAAFVDADAGEVGPRARRNFKNLPNARDEKTRSDWRNHNWKRQRKSQWKAKSSP